MQDLLNQFNSPSFWMVTVTLTIILNIGSSLILRALDKWRPSWSERRKQRSKLKNAAFWREVERCKADPTRILYFQSLMAMKAVYILFSFGMAGFMFVILFMATIAKSCGLYQQLWMMAISAFSIVAAFRSAVQFKQIYNLVWQAAAGDNDEEKLWL